jgi:uncharacterized protein YbaP (TraB family)
MLSKRIINFQFLILFLISCSTAKTETNSKIFLWKVQSAQNTVYLLGSIHLADSSLYPMDSRIEEAFEISDNLVVELDINKVNPGEIFKKAYYSDSNTLEKNISKETYKILDSIFQKHKIPASMFNKFKPWFATIMAMNLELGEKGFDEKMGIDVHFLDKAKDKKKILELESFDEQLKLFEELEDNPNDFVKYSIEDLNNSTTQMEEMLTAWKTGDTKTFEKLINEPVEQHPEFTGIMEKFIDKRNLKMIEKIKGYLDTKETYFVVVGAGHLIGKNGLVNLLQQTGKYKIVQY